LLSLKAEEISKQECTREEVEGRVGRETGGPPVRVIKRLSQYLRGAVRAGALYDRGTGVLGDKKWGASHLREGDGILTIGKKEKRKLTKGHMTG